jgi:hypothetical protein
MNREVAPRMPAGNFKDVINTLWPNAHLTTKPAFNGDAIDKGLTTDVSRLTMRALEN